MQSLIFLIGFMGSGKSTIGRLVAKDLSADFIDLDQLIEQSNKMTITEIFSMNGEHGFREKEQMALRSLKSGHAVIACGGGTPCFFDNMKWMNEHGITVFLDCTVDTLMNRLRSEQDQRPLIKGYDESGLRLFIEKKLEERRPYYTQAKLHVADMQSKSQIATWIVKSLQI